MQYYQDEQLQIINADVMEGLQSLDDGSVHCVVTSPPYWGLRDYGADGQIGLEQTPEQYVDKIVDIFRSVRRVLRKDGTVWLNLGDSYCANNRWGGLDGVSDKQMSNAGTIPFQKTNLVEHPTKPKDLVGIPWRVAFALQADGWYLRSDIIWSKPNPMPESVTDRPTKSHEYMFLLSKDKKYYFDADAVREAHKPESIARILKGYDGKFMARTREANPHDNRDGGLDANKVNPNGRNIRSVWNIATQPYSEAHFATFPKKLVEPCVKAGCPEGGTVLDPFGGSGTVGLVANNLGRKAILIELKADYCKMILQRCQQKTLL